MILKATDPGAGGNNITVTVSGLTISGAQAGDYTLAQPATTANITPAALTITGSITADKVYDGTTKATLNAASAALAGVVAGERVQKVAVVGHLVALGVVEHGELAAHSSAAGRG